MFNLALTKKECMRDFVNDVPKAGVCFKVQRCCALWG